MHYFFSALTKKKSGDFVLSFSVPQKSEDKQMQEWLDDDPTFKSVNYIVEALSVP